MKRRGDFRPWEIVLLVFAGILLVSSFALYVNDVSLRKYVLGWQDDAGSEQVGRMGKVKGVIRRQLRAETDFDLISKSAPLYNLDTLVTGTDGAATIELEDGGKIELGPNTMIRLAFESRLSLGGVARSANVEVVTGDVKGESKDTKIVLRSKDREVTISREKQESIRVEAQLPRKPVPVLASAPRPSPTPKVSALPIAKVEPSPSPSAEAEAEEKYEIKIVSPPRGERFEVAKGTVPPQKTVNLEWTVGPRDAELEVVMRRLKRGTEGDEIGDGAQVKTLFQQKVASKKGKASLEALLQSPGTFEWELRKGTRSLAKSAFILNRQFDGLETLQPLVGGRTLDSSEYNGEALKDFDITLRWKKFPEASKYTVQLLSTPTSTEPLQEKEVDGEQYVLNKDKVYSGRIYYRIKARLPSGFIVRSEAEPFIFNFAPPLLVLPKDGVNFSRKSLSASNNTILLTWQKTNFTDGYEIEVGSDNRFTRTFIKRRVKENFFVLKAPPTGKYWWRVRSFSKELLSPPSQSNEINLSP